MEKKIYRLKKKGIIGGVCAGFAAYLDIDVVIVRLIWVALGFCGFAGLLLYIVALFIMPVRNE